MEEKIVNAFKAACWDNPHQTIWVTYTAINRAVNKKHLCRGSVIERQVRSLVNKGILLRRMRGKQAVEFAANPAHPKWRLTK